MITTAWTIICMAQGQPADAKVRKACLEHLADNYRAPVVAMVRAWGIDDPHELEECVQDYFVRFLEKNWLDQLDQARGTFRGFLRVSVRNFLLNYKRGKGCRPRAVRLLPERNDEGDDGGVMPLASESDQPDVAFNRTWAREVIREALGRFEVQCSRRGVEYYVPVFERHVIMPEEYGHPSVRATAESLGMNERATTNCLYRARRMFASTVRQVLSETVRSSLQVEDELSDLQNYLRG